MKNMIQNSSSYVFYRKRVILSIFKKVMSKEIELEWVTINPNLISL